MIQGTKLMKELNNAIDKRSVVNSYKIRDWEDYKKLTSALINARDAIYKNLNGKNQ